MKKSLICAFIIALCLITSVGCRQNVKENTKALQTALDYIENVNSSNFEAAYNLLTTKAKETITAENFVKKYKAIFEHLQITMLNQTGQLSENAAEHYAVYEYTGTYQSTICGAMPFNFVMPLVKEGVTWRVDWDPSLIFPQMLEGDTVTYATTKSMRGEIFAGEDLLAANTPGVTIYADTNIVTDYKEFANEIAPYLSMAYEDILKKIEGRTGYNIPLKAFLPEQITDYTQEEILKIKGAGIDKRTYTIFRTYPQGEAFFHVVGYVGKITEKQLDKLTKDDPTIMYNSDSIVGQMGIEQAYETTLAGRDGVEISILDKDGVKKMKLFEVLAQNGADIQLTLDAGLQKQTYELMALYYRGDQTGVCVANDPQTGAVIAMVNYPSLDPNELTRGISAEKWKSISGDTRAIMLNRATNGLYPPGSIFKPLVGAMALEEGVIQADSALPENEEIVKDKWTPKRNDWNYPPITRIENKGGNCNLSDGIIWSDNIFFAWTAMKMGDKMFLDYCDKLGFGADLGFELPVTKSRVYNKGTDFHIKFLADSGYGQGEMLVTPLHANAMFGSLANNSIMMTPYIVDSLWRDQDGVYAPIFTTEPKAFSEAVFSNSVLNIIEPMTKSVMAVGTGRGMRQPYTTAGKTGTAEKSKIRDIAWMSAYKAEEPRNYNVTITIDTPAGDGTIKFDLANAMFAFDKTERNTQ